MSNEIFDKVKNILVSILNVDKDAIALESKFREDLGADSLDLVDLIMAFEDEFGGHISDEDARSITNVGEAVSFLEKHQAS